MKSIKPYKYSPAIHGVQVKPLTESGKKLSVRYDGLLSNSGATGIFVHYGFGESVGWKEVGEQQMERSTEGWETSISVQDDQLNFCFRDSAFNWDNNNGFNWIYKIS